MKKLPASFLSKINKINLTNLFSKDWLLKFVSLVLAVVLWYYVGGEDRVDKNVMIPIEIINLPRDLVISNQFKKEIEVTVSGPRSLILEMTSRAITRQVDLSAATPGTMVIENDNEHIPVPRGITVQRVQPSSIILSLDKLIQKKFPVSARTVGKVADGYSVKSLKIDPDVITITGPLTILSQFDELYTRSINLAGMKESIQLQMPLELDPAIIELIGETSVTAELSIGLETVTKTMKGLVVHAVIDGVRRDVKPETVRVTANIPRKLLGESHINLKDLFVVTAIQEEEGSDLKVKVLPRDDVELPIEILSIIPDSVLLVNDLDATIQKTPAEPDRPEGKAVEEGVIDREKTSVKLDDEASAVNDEDASDGDDKNTSPVKMLKSEKAKRKVVE
jgi:YbbR domain-containing protein